MAAILGGLDFLYARFFAFVSLFATGMLGFVLAANLIQALVFMLLSTIYMALVLPHHEHEEEHEGGVGQPVQNH